jgi:hypothetical protein
LTFNDIRHYIFSNMWSFLPAFPPSLTSMTLSIFPSWNFHIQISLKYIAFPCSPPMMIIPSAYVNIIINIVDYVLPAVGAAACIALFGGPNGYFAKDPQAENSILKSI